MFKRRPIKSSAPRDFTPVVPVGDNLAYTPSDMDRMRKQGKPIKANELPESLFSDGDTSDVVQLSSPSDRRGFDIVDAWELQQSARKRLKDAYNHPSSLVSD